MLEGKMVKIRFKRYFPEQRLWVFLGKILMMSENWIEVEGKAIILTRGGLTPHIDEESRVIVVPRENIAHMRILPEEFDLSQIKIETRGTRQFVKVEGGPDTSIGEV